MRDVMPEAGNPFCFPQKPSILSSIIFVTTISFNTTLNLSYFIKLACSFIDFTVIFWYMHKLFYVGSIFILKVHSF